MSVKPISRSSGRSATAASAYRSAEKIVDRRTGEIFDFRRKAGVEHSAITLPFGSNWTPSRSELWNSAEQAEKRKDACVAREHEIALPHELNEEQRLDLVKIYAQDLADRHNCAVDFAIHAPGKGERGKNLNWHAHVLCTTRQVSGHELGQKCQREKSGRDRRADLEYERDRWAKTTNLALSNAGINAYVDHRSLEAQGINRPAGIHNGPVVTSILRRGGHSYIEQRRITEVLSAAAQAGQLKQQKEDVDQQIIVIATDIQQALLERDRINAVSSARPTLDELRARSKINSHLKKPQPFENEFTSPKSVEINTERPR